MLPMAAIRPYVPLVCRISARFLSQNYRLVNLPIRVDRTRKWLCSQPHLFCEMQPNCFLTKVLFTTNSPDASGANDADESPPENKKRRSSKRRRIISDSESSDGENGTQAVNRKSESVLSNEWDDFIDRRTRRKLIFDLFGLGHHRRRRKKSTKHP